MKCKVLSGSSLKLIAVLCMVLDHTALILLARYAPANTPLFTIAGEKISLYFILRQIGRMAFPLFGFLIAQGYLHTRSKLRYGLILLLFAGLSEVPFDLMINGTAFSMVKQNIYFTLALGFAGIWITDAPKNQLARALGLLLIVLATSALNVDYGVRGVIFIVLMHHLRKVPAVQAVASLPVLSGGYAALCAFLPINLYNGKRGFIRGGFTKYCFYLFYPIHILILLAIKRFWF